MENRHSIRIIAGYKATIINGDKTYPGIIENISESGLNVLTDPMDKDIDARPEDIVELEFAHPGGELFCIHCKIKWLEKAPPHGIKNRLGLEFVSPEWDKASCFL